MAIPFIDLQAQRLRLGQPLEDAILKVVRSGAYIMGPEIAAFEKALGAFGEAPFVLSCGSGTEALQLPLMAWGIGPGDAVFCPSFTFAATAEVMPLVGASPVFVDILADTFRAQILRILGYRVQVVEFVSAEATVRNLLLRAECTVKPGQQQAVSEYLELRDLWQVSPFLETRLGERLTQYLKR